MPDECGWGLRRTIEIRRRKRQRLWIAGAGALAIAALCAPRALLAPRLVIWNASASVRQGLYWIEHGKEVGAGDLVLAWAPPSARSLAARRLYLPPSVPLIKRVAAIAGDTVCASGTEVRIDGELAAIRSAADSAGRPMPWWNGCRTLGVDEVFLLGSAPLSFDGRYFGITSKRDILGKAVLLWGR